jgi:hypothetical protein
LPNPGGNSFIQLERKNNTSNNTESFIDEGSHRYEMLEKEPQFAQLKFNNVTPHLKDRFTAIRYIFIEKPENRLKRLIFALLILVAASLLCFFLFQASIDWAASSRMELNKLREANLRTISDGINTKYGFVKVEI